MKKFTLSEKNYAHTIMEYGSPSFTFIVIVMWISRDLAAGQLQLVLNRQALPLSAVRHSTSGAAQCNLYQNMYASMAIC